MNVVGKTPDCKCVVGGIFKLFDTLGMPLADLFSMCTEKNLQVSMPHFYDDAIASGWKHKTIILRLREALTDAHNLEHANIVCDRLETIYNPNKEES